MKTRIAINGFGRIGRLVLRALLERQDHHFEIVAINDLAASTMNAYLLKYDSVHGTLAAEVTATEDALVIDGNLIKIFQERDPAALPWGDLGIDVVFECSGVFTSKDKAAAHLRGGAKKVLISAPATDVDLTVVYGVNHTLIDGSHQIISNASCTTNCLAPLAKILDDTCGIKHGFMTTIHAYTGDQRLIDTAHSDPRRARAAGLSMIPTSTGAARAVGLVLPNLKGKIDGTAIRVPTPNVSVVDFKFVAKQPVTSEALNAAFTSAAGGLFKGILSTTQEPLVSIDFNHSAYSSNVDLTQTQVIDGEFCRVLSWYDNEWGFANRMIDTGGVMAAAA
jgi:glyceraldehyde-3-phosphate dehydrogenase (EC 1.2.1.12)